ncbi:MAG TPA: hypothetical protein VM532_15365 [Burkholderiales bacterium]|jgi:hypothetical protein|nr:hypothetical protein [Burkholderiales bacterium]
MAHVSEILQSLLIRKKLTNSQRNDIQLHANLEINSGNPNWFNSVEELISQFIGDEGRGILNKLTDALLHVQVGSPELLLVVENMPENIVADALGRLQPRSA